jgi:hypothetical protein
MEIVTEPYLSQATNWPLAGRRIFAQYDEEGIVVGRLAYTHAPEPAGCRRYNDLASVDHPCSPMGTA